MPRRHVRSDTASMAQVVGGETIRTPWTDPSRDDRRHVLAPRSGCPPIAVAGTAARSSRDNLRCEQTRLEVVT
jgi:hypothetical protein